MVAVWTCANSRSYMSKQVCVHVETTYNLDTEADPNDASGREQTRAVRMVRMAWVPIVIAVSFMAN